MYADYLIQDRLVSAAGGIRVAPYDLRRTFAKLAHKGHAPLEQIQLSLGHASVQTTERYLGLEQDFRPLSRIRLSCWLTSKR